MIEPVAWDWVKTAACMNLERSGYLRPVLFCYGREGFAILMMEWDTPAAKAPVLIETVAHARQLAPTALGLMVDAWVVENPLPDEAAPSENPRSIECLNFLAVDGRGTVLEVRKYGRDDTGAVIWQEWEDMSTGLESWIVDLLRGALT